MKEELADLREQKILLQSRGYRLIIWKCSTGVRTAGIRDMLMEKNAIASVRLRCGCCMPSPILRKW